MIPALRTIGSRLEKMNIVWDEDHVDEKEYTNAWNMCQYLESISIQEYDEEHIRAMFATPKDRLKEINLMGASHPIDDNSILELIANGTGAAEVLYYAGTPPPPKSFDKFVDKNKSTLRSVTIFNYDEPIAQSDVGKMMEKFWDCPNLEYISFLEVPADDVLEGLRQRGIYYRRPTTA